MKNILFQLMLIMAILFPASSSFSEASATASTSDPCVAQACTAAIPLLAPFSITGRVIACSKETFDILFASDTCPSVLLGGLKTYVTPVVTAILTLALILLGIKVALKGDMPATKEWFSFILKFGVILYMCIGTGLSDIVYKGGMALITDLPNYLMSASTQTLCSYTEADYPDPKYSYLLAWDILDCRISHYLLVGVYDPNGIFSEGFPFGVLEVIFIFILSLQVIMAAVLLVFAIFILSLTLNFLNIVILAMLALGILTYTGFIFVPMMIFSYTSGYFDKWWKSVVSCALQPVIVASFMSLTFLAFDNIMYQGCTLGSHKNKNGKTVWSIPVSTDSPTCKDSIGYQLQTWMKQKFVQEIDALFFKFVTFTPSQTQTIGLLKALLKALIFCYLFMMIAKKGAEFASKLTSGPNIGKFAISAGAVVDFVLEQAGAEGQGGGDKDKKQQGSGSQASKGGGSGASASKAMRK